MRNFLEALKTRTLLCDGAFGTEIQKLGLDAEAAFRGAPGSPELLNISRPKLVASLHRRYLAAGADVIETNSFGAAPLTLAGIGREDEAFSVNYLAAQIAREAIAEAQLIDNRRRYVLGAIGPGPRPGSLGAAHLADDVTAIRDGAQLQAEGLLAGGVDGLIVETAESLERVAAVLDGLKKAAPSLPLIMQLAVERDGLLACGASIEEAADLARAFRVDALGLNCVREPMALAAPLASLLEAWPGPVTVQPSAGRPRLEGGEVRYPLGPLAMAAAMQPFFRESRLALIGGCCGTTPAHILALRRRLDGRSAGKTTVSVPEGRQRRGTVTARSQTARPARAPAAISAANTGAIRTLAREVQIIARLPVDEAADVLDREQLFSGIWGYRSDGRRADAFSAFAEADLAPDLDRHIAAARRTLAIQAAYRHGVKKLPVAGLEDAAALALAVVRPLPGRIPSVDNAVQRVGASVTALSVPGLEEEADAERFAGVVQGLADAAARRIKRRLEEERGEPLTMDSWAPGESDRLDYWQERALMATLEAPRLGLGGFSQAGSRPLAVRVLVFHRAAADLDREAG